jgi:hypothetical protein
MITKQQEEEYELKRAMWRRFRCRICGHGLGSPEEVMLVSIFHDDPDELDGICFDCYSAAHLRKHPGITCCEAQLGEDEGCCNPGICCGGKYDPNDPDQCDWCDSGRCETCKKRARLRHESE